MRQGPRHPIDPGHPHGSRWEEERQADGRRLPVLTVFLAGAECPFQCVYCDLWRYTHEAPTLPGAIPAQIDHALRAAGPLPAEAVIKLYNASNFFDPRAVPPEDDAAIAALVRPFRRVVVESHPHLVGDRARRFATDLSGDLEVAMGLESACPSVLSRLNKGMTLEQFDEAASMLVAAGISLRAFLLLPAPFQSRDEALEWVPRSVDYACAVGATHVSLIPTRGDMLGTVQQSGSFEPPDLALIERARDRCRERAGTVVTVDLWDIGQFVACEACGSERIARLRTINRTGTMIPRVSCQQCMSPS